MGMHIMHIVIRYWKLTSISIPINTVSTRLQLTTDYPFLPTFLFFYCSQKVSLLITVWYSYPLFQFKDVTFIL